MNLSIEPWPCSILVEPPIAKYFWQCHQPNHNDTDIVGDILTSFLNRKRIRINSRLSIRIFRIASFNLWQARARKIIWLAKPCIPAYCPVFTMSVDLPLPLISSCISYCSVYWPVLTSQLSCTACVLTWDHVTRHGTLCLFTRYCRLWNIYQISQINLGICNKTCHTLVCLPGIADNQTYIGFVR